MKNIILYSWVPLVISLIIFYLCCIFTIDNPDITEDWIIPFDKVGHFFMYFGLSGATAVNYILVKKGRVEMCKLMLGAFLLPVLYGGLIELVQHYYFPPRIGDWYDFLADLLGSLAALPIALIFKNHLIKYIFK